MSATLQCVSSGSIGNSYILDCNGEKLLIELGVPFKEILKAINFDIAAVVGCCVSHIHGDHSKGIKDALSYGLQVYAPQSVCEKYPNCKQVEHLHKYKVGGFTILPLRVPHGDCECVSYHIIMPDGQTLLFYTDCSDFNYKIPNVNFVLGEVNHSDSVILDNLCNGYDVRSQYENHLSLDTAVSVIRRLYSPKLSKVICCHLSTSNADTSEIKRRFRSELGIDVDFAESGKIFSLESCEF